MKITYTQKMYRQLLVISLTLLLTACGTSGVIKNANNNTFSISSQYGSVNGSWTRATQEATDAAVAHCASMGQKYYFINEQRTGVVGWSPQESNITFSCGADTVAIVKEIQNDCKERMQIADLDPIRNKVELFKLDSSVAPTFDIASNTDYPTATEKVAISKWAKIREECNAKSTKAYNENLQTSNAMQASFNQKQIEFRNQATSLIGSLIVALYQGKLPYGEFAIKRNEGYLAIVSAERDFRSATMIQDRNAQMQAQDLALRQQQNSINAFNGYMNSVNARQPMIQAPTPYVMPPLKSPTVTNCNKFGNNINCVTQ